MPDFASTYPQNPWESIENKERPWYFPTLYREYTRRVVYNRFVGMTFNHNGPRATELYIDSLIMPHTNHNPIGLRDMWLNSSTVDSFRRTIRFNRYGGKMSLNRYDDLVTFWQLDGTEGLKRIINLGLGHMMTNQMDKLARDAFMSMPYKMFGDGAGTWGGTGFNAIDADDKVTTTLLQDIRLGLKERDVPIAQDMDGAGLGDTVYCITSPGVLRDLRNELSSTGNSNAFIDVNRYSNPQMINNGIINGESGAYQGVRFIESNNAILYNCGAITTQKLVKAPINAGDGTPAGAVDGIEIVGQPSAQHYIQLDSVTGLAVNDIVTLHVNRTNANGVTNGVDYKDGYLHNLRIVSIDAVNFRISVARPVLENFTTDLGSTVYGYVTKGRHIHSMLFITGENAVVMGAAQPPTIHVQNPIDDLGMIYRFSFDYYMGWQPFEKNGAEVVFLAGSNRYLGSRVL